MRKIVSIAILLMMFSTFAFADDLASIIPSTSIWGISMNDFRQEYKNDYKTCKVGDDSGLYIANVDVYSYDMNAYYIFGEELSTDDGWDTYAGLSKIAYILNDSGKYTDAELEQCCQTIIERIKEIEGEPDSVKNNTTIWKNGKYKIEIGKGKLSKYIGTDNVTVAIIFKGIDIPSPTLKPTLAPTPMPMEKRKRYPPALSDEELEEYCKMAFDKILLNPESLQIHSIKVTNSKNRKNTSDTEYFDVIIDYSAMNRMGGYGRESFILNMEYDVFDDTLSMNF